MTDYSGTKLKISRMTHGAMLRGEINLDDKYIGWFTLRFGGQVKELTFLDEMEKRWNEFENKRKDTESVVGSGSV